MSVPSGTPLNLLHHTETDINIVLEGEVLADLFEQETWKAATAVISR